MCPNISVETENVDSNNANYCNIPESVYDEISENPFKDDSIPELTEEYEIFSLRSVYLDRDCKSVNLSKNNEALDTEKTFQNAQCFFGDTKPGEFQMRPL